MDKKTTKQTYERRLAKWLKALRSGKFKQCQDTLGRFDEEGEARKESFCCLGVACEIAMKDGVKVDKGEYNDNTYHYDANTGILPEAVRKYFGLESREGFFFDATEDRDPTVVKVKGSEAESLVQANDNALCSFKQIARLIEVHKKRLFTWA